MNFGFDNRVRFDQAANFGNGDIPIAGAVPVSTRFHLPSAALDGKTCEWSIEHQGDSDYENIRAVYDHANGLILRSSGTVIEGSNGLSRVVFNAGTKRVVMTVTGQTLMEIQAALPEAVHGGTFNPADVTIANYKTIYSTYTQSGAVTFTLDDVASTFNGGLAVVPFNSNGAALTWTSGDFINGVTNAEGDLPSSLPSGVQTIMFEYDQTLNKARVYLGRATAAEITATAHGGIAGTTVQAQLEELESEKAATAHSHAQSDITNLVSDLAAKAPLASPAFTGNPSEAYADAGNKSGAASFAYGSGSWQKCVATGNITSVAITGAPASGRAAQLLLEIHQDATGNRTIAWGSAFRFPGGTDYTLSTAANAIDFFTLVSRDGGTTWHVFEAGKAMAA